VSFFIKKGGGIESGEERSSWIRNSVWWLILETVKTGVFVESKKERGRRSPGPLSGKGNSWALSKLISTRKKEEKASRYCVEEGRGVLLGLQGKRGKRKKKDDAWVLEIKNDRFLPFSCCADLEKKGGAMPSLKEQGKKGEGGDLTPPGRKKKGGNRANENVGDGCHSKPETGPEKKRFASRKKACW